MGGLIAMACGETARFSEPYDSLMNLQRPESWGFRQFRSISIAENWNAAADMFLSTDAEWLFLVNDDHVYPPDTLVRLLSHDKDVVTGLYVMRQLPFLPVLSNHVMEDGGAEPSYLTDGERGLVRRKLCGDGCLLIRRSVIEAIPPPRWELGVYRRDAVDHDNAFCAKVRDAGFTIWCDLDTYVIHLAVIAVAPQRDAQGHWHTVFIAGDKAFRLPAVRSPFALVN